MAPNPVETIGKAVFSPDSRYLLTISTFGKWILWEVASGKPARSGEGMPGNWVFFTPNGKQIIAANLVGGGIGVWDVASGQQVHGFASGEVVTAAAPAKRSTS